MVAFWFNNELLLTLPILHTFVGCSLWIQDGIADFNSRKNREPEDLRPAIKNSGPEMAQVTCTYHVMARNNSHTQLQKKWRSTDVMFSWA